MNYIEKIGLLVFIAGVNKFVINEIVGNVSIYDRWTAVIFVSLGVLMFFPIYNNISYICEKMLNPICLGTYGEVLI